MEQSSGLVGYIILGSLTLHMMIGLGNGMIQRGKVWTLPTIGELACIMFVYVLMIMSMLDMHDKFMSVCL
jgi:hypothetical protein